MTEFVFSFDTEDFVTPDTDDALLAIAQLLTRHGIRASFAVVGDKARALWSRRRQDVFEALSRHDIQYHANNHLLWPQTTLELSRLRWEEGVDLVLDTEARGLADVAEAFGQRPVAYIRNGGNWDPRLLYGLSLLGIQGFVPSAYLLPEGGPLWYAGVLNYWYSIAMERFFEKGAEALAAEFRRQKQRLAGSDIPIVAYAHPCMFITSQFYDLHNMPAHGVFPPKKDWRPAPLLSSAEFERRLAVLEGLARAVAADPDVEAITHREFLLRRREAPRWLGAAEVRQAAAAIRATFDYHRLGDGWLSTADVFGALSAALTGRAAAGALPASVPVRRLVGPPEAAPPLARAFSTTGAEIAAACAQIEDEIDRQHRMPSQVTVAGRAVPPSSFLLAMAAAVGAPGLDSPVEVSPAPAFPLCQAAIYGNIRVRSSELPDDFEEGSIVTHTHLQTWTARPAVRL